MLFRGLSKTVESNRPSLREYTNQELIEFLQHNNEVELRCLSGILSEILRRMNEISPLLPLKPEEWVAEWVGTLKCNTSDGRTVNSAEELNRLENEQSDWGNPITP